MEDEEIVYPSKIDWWIGLIMVGVPLIHLPLGVMVMMKGLILYGILLIFWGLIIAAILSTLTFPCRYTVSNSNLKIQSGLVTDSFPLSKIEDVKPTRTIVASPALSLDRLELKLSDGTVRIISPVKQEEFISRIKGGI